MLLTGLGFESGFMPFRRRGEAPHHRLKHALAVSLADHHTRITRQRFLGHVQGDVRRGPHPEMPRDLSPTLSDCRALLSGGRNTARSMPEGECL